MNKSIKILTSILSALLITGLCLVPAKADIYGVGVQTETVDNSVCECKRDIYATLTINYTEDDTPLVYEIKEIVPGDDVTAFKDVEDEASLEVIERIKKDFEKYAKNAGYNETLEFNCTSTRTKSFDNREYSMITSGEDEETISSHMLIEGNYGIEMEYTITAEITVEGLKPQPTEEAAKPTTVPTKVPTKDTQSPKEDREPANLLWLWILLAILLILAAAFTAYKLVFSKKQK